MSVIAIGDIHGCARTLELMLRRLDPSPEDHLVFVGDYIDRGPDSKGVIDQLIRLRDSVPCTFLRGNHEALMLGYLDRGEFELWAWNGGDTTLESYRTGGGDLRFADEHIAFVRATLPYLDTDDFFFVHGGVPPDLTIADAINRLDEQTFLWERSHLAAPERAWEKTVVCGHTPRPEPLVDDRLIVIDTGCVYPQMNGMGRLTAVHLPERFFVFENYAG